MTTHTAHTTARENVELGRHFFQAQDRLLGGPAPELCAPEYTATLGGNAPVNREGHEHFAIAFYGGFPDMRHHFEDVFATEDRVAVRFVLRGTHTGNFFGIPASGKAVVVVANVLMQVSDGRVTKLFGVFDEAGLLRQIGAL